ncbi:MAG: lysine 2,3-aminomutase [Deltaproteobacteria bacterium]|nr:lysine 2,3-aminomutase [Deltaproteobacteria bacterium]
MRALPTGRLTKRRFRALQRQDLDDMACLDVLSSDERLAMKAVSAVLPFRVNPYVTEELIRWRDVPNDPIYQLTFPQPGMLDPADLARMIDLVRRDAPDDEVRAAARLIQARMNPHPAGQRELNVPRVDGRALPGMQHKYRETVLFFPSQGQTCHAYCTYCFRWAQFVGLDELRFASREVDGLVAYLRAHEEVSSVLVTGGDPLMMKTAVLARYVEPLLGPDLEHVTSLRIGTKAPAYWPQRFFADDDADELLRLFEAVVRSGKNLALMAHYSHPRELETPAAQAALRRIRETGAVVRCQAPLVRHVNDDARTWSELWRLQVQLGAVPYYMFVERDTGPKDYFAVPLARAVDIFREAFVQVSGLARTVRGPSMSATPGKVAVDGVARIGDEDVFVLRFLQARDPDWVGRPFFARFDPAATWLDQLRPVEPATEFFWEPGFRALLAQGAGPAGAVPRRRPVIFGHVAWE